MSATLAAGCTDRGTEQAVQAETRTPVENRDHRRETVQHYADGADAFGNGRSKLFDGNGAIEDGDYRAADTEFERAAADFEAALEAFERAYERITWLDFESDRDGERARTVVEDAARRVEHHIEAVGKLQTAAARRANDGDGADPLAAAREHLESAQDYPMRDASRLAETLSVEGD